MPLRFNCENCDVRIKVPDRSEGKKVHCPSCGHAQRVPGAAGVAAVPAAAAARPSGVQRPVAATSATPPLAVDRPRAVEQAKPAREPFSTEPAAQESVADADEALAALAAAAEDDQPLDAQPEPTPPVKRNRPAQARTRGTRAAAQPAPPPDPAVDQDESIAAEAETESTSVAVDGAELNDGAAVMDEAPAAGSLESEASASDAGRAAAHGQLLTITAPPAEEPVFTADAAPLDVSPPLDAARSPEIDGRSLSAPASPAEPSDELSNASTVLDYAAQAPQPVAPAMNLSPSEAGEAPAGEVRDLFDDFVRREQIARKAEEEAKRAAKAPAPREPALRPTPVVVTKTLPRPVRAAAATARAPATASRAEARDAAADPDGPEVVVTTYPAPAPRSPQAIPLAHRPTNGPAAPVQAAPVAPAAPPQALVPPAAAALAVTQPAPVQPRRAAPPAYALLLVLCWALRVLACLSLGSVVKLLLLWSDAGATMMDILFVLPLGVGVAAAIWGVGETARVTRDAARNAGR